MVDIYIKGKNNRVTCCYDDEFNKTRVTGCSNNQLEWIALIKAMESISGNWEQEEEYNIYTDSYLLYRQLVGEYRIKSKNLKPFYFKWNMLKNILMDFTINYLFVSGNENIARNTYANKR